MAEKTGRPPIIIIGMHRSGTSMVARMLEELGLFVGKKKPRHYEAVFFLRLNEWLFRQSGGTWDHPEPIRDLLRHREARALAVDHIRRTMNSPLVTTYLGWPNYLRYTTPQKMDTHWGWKDPRSTYTLPLWLELFPEARIIHVYRHGVDVANSLKVREAKTTASAKARHGKRKALYWFRPEQARFSSSLRCNDLNRAFELWFSYVAEAKAQTSRLGNRAMELKYEDFLAEPYQSLTSLVRFCGLPEDEGTVASISKTVKRERAYAYQSNPELRALAERYSSQLSRWGYG